MIPSLQSYEAIGDNRLEIDQKPIITVQDLVAQYGENIILDGVNLEVFEGEILVVLGGSGCGKSTLLTHGGA